MKLAAVAVLLCAPAFGQIVNPGGGGAVSGGACPAGQYAYQIDTVGSPTCRAIPSGQVTGLAPSATTDTTNAANITSGVLPQAQTPAPTNAKIVNGLGYTPNIGVPYALFENLAVTGVVDHSESVGSTDPIDINTYLTRYTLTHVPDMRTGKQAGIGYNRMFLERGGNQSVDVQQNAYGVGGYLRSNTDVQVGGLLNFFGLVAGQGDLVGHTQQLVGYGNPTGYGEGVESERRSVEFHSQNWGFTIGTLTNNATTGESALRSTLQGDNISPITLAGHDLRMQTDNTLLIDITAARTYTTGNVQSISTVPSGTLPSGTTGTYVYLVGDSAAGWTSKYGTSTLTTLTTAVPQYVNSVNQFANGAISVTLNLASATGFTVGNKLTFSDNQQSYEEATIKAVSGNTVTVYLSKPHAVGSLVTTGGGIGHAINLVADSVAVGAWPATDQGTNGSVYRLAYPIIATLANNAILVDTFGFNQSQNYGTRALASTTINRLPTATLSNGNSLNVTDQGDRTPVLPSGTSYFGGIQLPMPTMVFASNTCTTQPSGHWISANNGSSFLAVLDTNGVGCPASIAVTATSTVTNAYEIHASGWIRDTFNPNWPATCDPANRNVPGQCDYRNPEKQNDPPQIITAASSGYAVLDSVSSEIAVGDAVEGVYNRHQLMKAQDSYRRPVYDPGVQGGIIYKNFVGLGVGDAADVFSNLSPMRDYTGTPAGFFQPDAGTVAGAPYLHRVEGSWAEIFRIGASPSVSATQQNGVIFDIYCNSTIANNPCASGVRANYDFLRHSDTYGQRGINFQENTDPNAATFVMYDSNGSSGLNGLAKTKTAIWLGSVDATPIGANNASTGVFTQISTAGGNPTIANGAAAGTSPGTPTITGTNLDGVLTVITGTATAANGTLATVTFNGTLGTAPRTCQITARNSGGAANITTIYTGAPSTTSWVIGTGSAAPAVSTTMSWSYSCR